jgi:hypothetical protein
VASRSLLHGWVRRFEKRNELQAVGTESSQQNLNLGSIVVCRIGGTIGQVGNFKLALATKNLFGSAEP